MTNKTSKIPDENITRPYLSFYESWQDENGIDTSIWTPTNPATGTAWGIGQYPSSPWNGARAIPNANENCRLVAVHRWPSPIIVVRDDLARTIKKLIFEFHLGLSVQSRIDNAATLIGLSAATGDTRAAATGWIGWGLASDVLQSVTTADGVVEETNTGFGEALANPTKLKIEIMRNQVRFFVNEALVAVHTNTDRLPIQRLYPNFYFATDAGGLCQVNIGLVRLWTEDVIR